MRQLAPFSRLLNFRYFNAKGFDQPVGLAYEFKARDFLVAVKNLRIIDKINQINMDSSFAAKDKRRYPLDFGGYYSKRAESIYNLPSNLRIKYLPQDIHLDNPWFHFSMNFQPQKGKIIFKEKFSVKKRFVPVPEYKQFKEAFEQMLYLMRKEIILQKR